MPTSNQNLADLHCRLERSFKDAFYRAAATELRTRIKPKIAATDKQLGEIWQALAQIGPATPISSKRHALLHEFGQAAKRKLRCDDPEANAIEMAMKWLRYISLYRSATKPGRKEAIERQIRFQDFDLCTTESIAVIRAITEIQAMPLHHKQPDPLQSKHPTLAEITLLERRVTAYEQARTNAHSKLIEIILAPTGSSSEVNVKAYDAKSRVLTLSNHKLPRCAPVIHTSSQAKLQPLYFVRTMRSNQATLHLTQDEAQSGAKPQPITFCADSRLHELVPMNLAVNGAQSTLSLDIVARAKALDIQSGALDQFINAVLPKLPADARERFKALVKTNPIHGKNPFAALEIWLWDNWPIITEFDLQWHEIEEAAKQFGIDFPSPNTPAADTRGAIRQKTDPRNYSNLRKWASKKGFSKVAGRVKHGVSPGHSSKIKALSLFSPSPYFGRFL